MSDIVLGPPEEFAALPANIELEGYPYYLIWERSRYRLLPRTCPRALLARRSGAGTSFQWLHPEAEPFAVLVADGMLKARRMG